MLVVQHDNGLHESHRVIFFTVFFLFFRHSRFHGLDTVFARSQQHNNTSGFGLRVFPAGGGSAGSASGVGGFGLGIFRDFSRYAINLYRDSRRIPVIPIDFRRIPINFHRLFEGFPSLPIDFRGIPINSQRFSRDSPKFP